MWVWLTLRVGRSLVGSGCEDIGHIAIGHAGRNLKLGQMAKYVYEKIHWLQCSKCFCMCIHRHHMEKGDVRIPIIKHGNHLSEREMNTLRSS